MCSHTIEYADDTLVLTGNISELQMLLDRINEVGEISLLGLSINVAKTKFMVFSRQSHDNASI